MIISDVKFDLEILQDVKGTEEIINDDEEEWEIYEVPIPGIKYQQAIRFLSRFYDSRGTETTNLKLISQFDDDKVGIFFSNYKQQKVDFFPFEYALLATTLLCYVGINLFSR